MKLGGKDGLMAYSNVQDYINDNSYIGPLLFDKLDYLFRLYFAFLILRSLFNQFTIFSFKSSSIFSSNYINCTCLTEKINCKLYLDNKIYSLKRNLKLRF